MDVDEGFILGIYNYCDRWCETCRFTSRCRVFADGAEYDAASTPELKELSRTPQHPSDVRPTPGWLEDILAEVNDQDLPELPVPPPMPGHLRRLSALSGAYCDHAWAAIEHDDARESRPPDDPRSIILWFAPLIASKTRRALSGLNEFDGCRDYPPDFEGSAKVALIGIDRSMMAWADARRLGHVSVEHASRFIGELHHLCTELEEVIPKAREFIRPGFDQPDEVRRLDESDWS